MLRKFSNSGCNLILYALILFAGSLFSCRPVRHIPDNSYLLNKYKIESSPREIKKDEIRKFVRQKPNKKILGFRFHLWLHNMANPQKNKWPHNWLRRIGEEPVIYDPFLTTRSAAQIEQFLRNKGYYNASVTDTVYPLHGEKRARVTYMIDASDPYYISSLNYIFEDEGIRETILADTLNSLIGPGIIFDVDLLQNERVRLESHLKSQGFFYFSRDHIHFIADTTGTGVNLTMEIRRYRKRDADGQFVFLPHKRYKIGNIFVLPSFNPRDAIDRQDHYYKDLDTLVFRNMYYLYRDRMPVHPRVLAQSNFILPDELYNQENVERTYRHLYALRMFRLVNIRFTEPPNQSDTAGYHLQDAWLQLTPSDVQAYTIEMEGTNSSGDFGFGGNLMYQHRNFLGGAEILDIKLKGSVEALNERTLDESMSFTNTYEYGAEANLQIPRFLLPIRSISFVRKYNPRTNITMAYNYQLRPDYNRTIARAAFGYSWRGSQFTTHLVSPLEINLVQLPFSTPEFDERIRRYRMEASYRDHLVTETNYSLIFNNQDIRSPRDFVYLRFNAETAGNILAAISSEAGRPKKDGYYRIFGSEFAQYVKSDIDLRYYRVFSANNSLVYRLFAGGGLPYGNSTALPFEKKYFAGGANSIRAWQVRSLGPGSFSETSDTIFTRFHNTTADIKLEANIEYRFSLFWLIEGAMFVDAGNIWAITRNDGREGALFRPNKFHHDIAVGTGFGLRFDFSFFVFRVDMGMKLRDPAEVYNRKWIPLHRQLNFQNDFTFNVGIGYPF